MNQLKSYAESSPTSASCRSDRARDTPLSLLTQRFSTRVVVVRELFFLVTSAICVRIRGHRSEATKIVYHVAQVFRLLLRSYHSGFVGTISTLFCCVNIKLILLFVDWRHMLVSDCNLVCFC